MSRFTPDTEMQKEVNRVKTLWSQWIFITIYNVLDFDSSYSILLSIIVTQRLEHYLI